MELPYCHFVVEYIEATIENRRNVGDMTGNCLLIIMLSVSLARASTLLQLFGAMGLLRVVASHINIKFCSVQQFTLSTWSISYSRSTDHTTLQRRRVSADGSRSIL